MVVEDILDGLSRLVVAGKIKGAWHIDFISNVQGYVGGGGCLSTNQGTTLLKLATSNTNALAQLFSVSSATMKNWIDNPTYRQSPYQSTSVKREVRYLGGDQLAFRFKADKTVTDDLKALKTNEDVMNTRPKWNSHYRVWVVTVTATNLEKIMTLIQKHLFAFDTTALEYITICNNSKAADSTFFSMEEEGLIYGNIACGPILASVLEKTCGARLV
jgi:hypothetical protein